MAKKEVDYKALADKNKRVREFGERRFEVRNAKEFEKSPEDLKRHLTNYDGEESKVRNKKYTFGLATLDENISKRDTPGAYKIFSAMSESLDKEKTMPKEEVEKYQKALAKRGYRLVNRLHQNHSYTEKNEEILKYCDEHLGSKSSGLEKAITVISLLSLVLGIAIGYPVLTGNVIAEHAKSSASTGLILFVIGLLGVFLANRE